MRNQLPLIGRAEIQLRAWTGDLPRDVHGLQERLGQGPCLDAAGRQEIVRVDDVGADDRWPEFARRVAVLGARSMLFFPLFVEGDQLGALTLFSRVPGCFDDEAQEIGRMFAAHAAVALAGAEHESHLGVGMNNSDVIGQRRAS